MQTLNIDVISDVVCPWCYVGKRRLEGALEMWAQQHPDVAPMVRWHTFQLNPDLSPEGADRDSYVRAKFGERADTVYERVKEVGLSVGIDFAFDEITRQPNTLAAHTLVAESEPGEAQERMVEALFRAYFLEGRDLTDAGTLLDIAALAGMSRELAEECLQDPARHAQTQAADQAAREMGITGVPFFIFNRKVGVSGAHESESLFEAMQQALDA